MDIGPGRRILKYPYTFKTDEEVPDTLCDMHLVVMYAWDSREMFPICTHDPVKSTTKTTQKNTKACVYNGEKAGAERNEGGKGVKSDASKNGKSGSSKGGKSAFAKGRKVGGDTAKGGNAGG